MPNLHFATILRVAYPEGAIDDAAFMLRMTPTTFVRAHTVCFRHARQAHASDELVLRHNARLAHREEIWRLDANETLCTRGVRKLQ